MRRYLFTAAAALSLLAGFALLLAPIWSLFHDLRGAVNLPGGIQLVARGAHGQARLGIMRWGVESKQWWRERPGLAPMRVTGETVILTQNATIQYASNLHVDFGAHDWYGIQWRSGATSKAPVIGSAGAMSTPLVPFRSWSVPWFYPLPLLLILPVIWTVRLVRERKKGPGLCPGCGYDLRATPYRCPECGAVPTKS
jgi:hypothetical protein